VTSLAAAATCASTTPRLDGEGVLAFDGRALGSSVHLFVDPLDTSAMRAAGRPAERVARDAWGAVCDELEAVDRALSRFRDDSELTAVNRLAGTDRVVEVSWRMRTALAAMDRARRLTAGRFDASVLRDLERLGEHGADLAPGRARAGDVGRAGEVVNAGEFDLVALPNPLGPPSAAPHRSAAATRGVERPSRVHVPPVALDSGGIGKGLALRWAIARASAIDPELAMLLDAGGDVVAGGRPRTGGWRVGIEDPADPDGPPLVVVDLDRGAIATSSVGVRNWTAPDGRSVHHLLDPRTGEPARTGLVAVSVAGPDPAWAEVWTKALFLSGRAAIGDEARARGLAAWWVDEAGQLGMTPAARLQSEWVAEERLG
jgi:thiamine biosynthesis lipoprotein